MASYVDSNLMPGEDVQFRGKIHWGIYIPWILLTVVTVLFAAPLLLIPLIKSISTEMAVTNRRVMLKTGWLSRRTVEMNLAKIETVNVDQGIVGRMLGYGTVVMVGTGGTGEPLSFVSDPLAVRRAVLSAIESRVP